MESVPKPPPLPPAPAGDGDQEEVERGGGAGWAATTEEFLPLETRWEDAQTLYAERACRFPTPLELRTKEDSLKSKSFGGSRSASLPSFSLSASSKASSPKKGVPTWEQPPEEEASPTEELNRDTLEWIRTDRRLHPSCPALDHDSFPSPYYKYKPKLGRVPHELWLPEISTEKRVRERKEKKQKEREEREKERERKASVFPLASGKGKGKGKGDEKKAAASSPEKGAPVSPSGSGSLGPRPTWHARHQIPDSKCNHEIQVNVRTYFGLIGSADNDNRPRAQLANLYHYTDRCVEFPDHRTVFGTVLCGGVKGTQLPSQWRMGYAKKATLMGKDPQVGWLDGMKFSKRLQQRVDKAAKNKALPKRRPRSESAAAESRHKELLQKVSSLGVDGSVEYWKEWSQHSKLRLPEDPKQKKKGKKGAKDLEPEEQPKISRSLSPRRRKRWDARFSVSMSKDNEVLHDQHRKYFTRPQLLSGVEYGKCERLLTMPCNKWKALLY